MRGLAAFLALASGVAGRPVVLSALEKGGQKASAEYMLGLTAALGDTARASALQAQLDVVHRECEVACNSAKCASECLNCMTKASPAKKLAEAPQCQARIRALAHEGGKAAASKAVRGLKKVGSQVPVKKMTRDEALRKAEEVMNRVRKEEDQMAEEARRGRKPSKAALTNDPLADVVSFANHAAFPVPPMAVHPGADEKKKVAKVVTVSAVTAKDGSSLKGLSTKEAAPSAAQSPARMSDASIDKMIEKAVKKGKSSKQDLMHALKAHLEKEVGTEMKKLADVKVAPPSQVKRAAPSSTNAHVATASTKAVEEADPHKEAAPPSKAVDLPTPKVEPTTTTPVPTTTVATTTTTTTTTTTVAITTTPTTTVRYEINHDKKRMQENCVTCWKFNQLGDKLEYINGQRCDLCPPETNPQAKKMKHDAAAPAAALAALLAAALL